MSNEIKSSVSWIVGISPWLVLHNEIAKLIIFVVTVFNFWVARLNCLVLECGCVGVVPPEANEEISKVVPDILVILLPTVFQLQKVSYVLVHVAGVEKHICNYIVVDDYTCAQCILICPLTAWLSILRIVCYKDLCESEEAWETQAVWILHHGLNVFG